MGFTPAASDDPWAAVIRMGAAADRAIDRTRGERSSMIEIERIGIVKSGRAEAKDDDWGGTESRIVLDERFEPDALQGLEDFSHAEILFHFDRVDPAKIVSGARHPRNNPDWPAVGIFAQRGKNRPNRIGSTICRILGREGRVVRVAELDAIEGTPVIDIKPVMKEFLPRTPLRQPVWSGELMRAYWNPNRPA
jgi:tRNA-Thr(GGU) m(6)t(6)A37 methyltransferase TsaA